MSASRLTLILIALVVAACGARGGDVAHDTSASGPPMDSGSGGLMVAPTMAIENTYEVTANDIRNLLAGEGGVDLEPIFDDGRQTSMRVVGVKPGTTAARLGAVNGDVIETINDLPLTSIAGAYAVAAKVAQAPTIVVRGHRGSTPFTTTLRF